jgi:hypothetical protein
MLQFCSSINAHTANSRSPHDRLRCADSYLDLGESAAGCRRRKSGAEGIRTPDPLTASQSRTAPPSPVPSVTVRPHLVKINKDPDPIQCYQSKPMIARSSFAPHQRFLSTVDGQRVIIPSDRRRSTAARVSAGRHAKGRHLDHSRCRPIPPSGRQDLNLRPLDPQSLVNAIRPARPTASRKVERPPPSPPVRATPGRLSLR